MKKKFTLLAFTVLTISLASIAQINKGSIALGGNLNFSSANSKNDAGFKETTSTISLSPSLMTFYENNRAVGFNLSYTHAKFDETGSNLNRYGAGVFLRQYKPLGKNFYAFAQELLSYSYYKSKGFNDSAFIEGKNNAISFTLNPGIAYNICKRFQLELLFFNNLLSAGYSHDVISGQNVSTIKSNNFNISANLDGSQLTSLNIGAKIYFGKK